MSSTLQDIRYAFRALRKSPGFTAVAVLTLALGIGANTVMFSVVNGMLLRPLSYPAPERIAELAASYRQQRAPMGVTYKEFRFIEANADALAPVAATTRVGFNLFADDRADRVNGLRVSPGYFRVLGIQPQLGRPFTDRDDQPDGPNVAILSHGLWARRFGSDPAVLGRRVLVDGQPYTIVGVMPPGFQAIPSVDLWSTIAQVGRTIGSGQNLEVIGRLAPGLSLEQARLRMAGLTPEFGQQFDRMRPGEPQLDLMSYQDVVVSDVRDEVGLLFGAIAFVLLIACANVANLVLGRTTARAREVAVRIALGAGRARIIRLMISESLLLALGGGGAGLVLAHWGLRWVLAIAPRGLPRSGDLHLDGWALAFAVGLSLLVGVLFGLVPAWRAAGPDQHATLKEGAGRSTEPAGRSKARGALVIAEVALSLVLLVGAGLLTETFSNLTRVNPGFRSDHLLTAEIWLTGSRYDSTAGITRFYRALTDRIAGLPGVRAAGVVEAGLPLERGGNVAAQLDDAPCCFGADYRTVTPGYLPALGTPLIRGRMLTDQDGSGTEPVAVVNQSLARAYQADSLAVGHTIRIEGVARRVVGVVGDMKSHVGSPARPTVFLPSAQTPAGITHVFEGWFPIHVVVRTASDPEALRRQLLDAIAQTDPVVPIGRVRTMDQVLADSLAFQRFTMILLGLFAVMAMGLAALGIYGVMSYLMIQRTHEAGIRLALGALPRDIMKLMLGRGLLLFGIGSAVGLAGALALTRILQSRLYGVAPRDPATFAAAVLLLGGVALLASYVPARRATRVDPVEALRVD